jgi:hypothetical protein
MPRLSSAQAAIEILPRLHHVAAVLHEELRPVGVAAFVQGGAIVGVQAVDLHLQQQCFDAHTAITFFQ